MIKNIDEVSCSFLADIDLLCFSHLRWGFVFQRPNHLLTRFSAHQRVFFIEEPIFHDGADELKIDKHNAQLYIVTPHLSHHSEHSNPDRLSTLVNQLRVQFSIEKYINWYYTPMALGFTQELCPELTVYDCMDELSAFKFAPAELKGYEKDLLRQADVVFTGGNSIYHFKKHLHPNIHSFPSSIDKTHFGKARTNLAEPEDQKHIPHPRFGFFGVVDERFDIELIESVARQRPDWHFVIIGPIVKIDPATLPHYENVHYLGGKKYEELPSYIASWDVALVPFAQNESTRFISPTKTPEYLAAGIPVISTPITDVVDPYGDNKLVHIVSDAAQFIKAAETELAKKRKSAWLKKVDEFLKYNSWDRTWSQMVRLMEKTMTENELQKQTKQKKVYV